ncbi:MAG: hypothetical protein F4027_06560 [Rhodospirillaceae bacterium]|nr:hypothetical protein [Rhodospirillaceae bacterium]MYK58270.1 hypothetical protein [Rhodospirillaceae bacterium]
MSAFDEDTAQEGVPGRAVVALFFFVFGAGGLALMPLQTGTSPGDEGWFTQPWLMPLLTLGLLTAVSLLFVVKLWRDGEFSRSKTTGAALAGEAWVWLRSAEFFAWYVAYIVLLGLIGYGLSTFLFVACLGLRVGLRQPQWLLAALGATLAMVLLFRLGLEIWVPPADLYDLLPKSVAVFLQRYF